MEKVKLSSDQLNELLRNNPTLAAANPELNKVGDKRASACTQFQEHQIDLPKQAKRKAVHRDKAREKTLDGSSHPKYRIAIVIRVCDARPRDIDGAASTLLDCLISAVGRLNKMGSRAER